MAELVITRGLPGSGKTTFARAWVAEDRQHRARVNRDDLRQMVDEGEFVKGVTEQRIQALRDAAIRGLLTRGVSVVCDDTNLPNRTCRDLHDLAARSKADFRIQDFTTVSAATCIAQNLHRWDKTPIPQHVIEDMNTRYLRGRTLPLEFYPLLSMEGRSLPSLYVPDESLPLAFICDIDGTIALKGDRDPFDETRVSEDKPNPRVIEVVNNHIKLGYQPLFVSGRTDGCYGDTRQWLTDNLDYDGEYPGSVVNDYGVREKMFMLWMRAIADGRKDAVVKREIFDQHIRHSYNVRFNLDDRDQVVKMWRNELGLTCMQVAEGHF